MRPIILKCPSCDGNLTVARLECPDCSISIEGEFAPPALLKLTGAQIDFIEVFIKNRGVIREVERELGVSYPTVRARLDDVITALGYSPNPRPKLRPPTTAARGAARSWPISRTANSLPTKHSPHSMNPVKKTNRVTEKRTEGIRHGYLDHRWS